MVVICVWCPLLFSQVTSYSCFQTNVLVKFVDIICIFFYIHAPYFMCHCTEYKLSALQVRISGQNTLNATTQQFVTAKTSGCASKHGTDMCIFLLKQTVSYYVSKDTPVLSAFLDATKAFDRTNHNLLFAKLIKRNVPMCIVRLLLSWYMQQTMQVKWGTNYSSPFTVTQCSPIFFWLALPFLTNFYRPPTMPSTHINTIFRIVCLVCLKMIKTRMSAKKHFTIKPNLVH